MNVESRRELGARLREAREYLGFTQDEVGKALKVTQAKVSQVESGRRRASVSELAALANLYQRPVAHFLGEPAEVAVSESLAELLRSSPDLPDSDVDEVLRFAEFLRDRKAARS